MPCLEQDPYRNGNTTSSLFKAHRDQKPVAAYAEQNSLTSFTNSSGRSKDGKWPPTLYSLQNCMLATCWAQSLGHWETLCQSSLLGVQGRTRTYAQLFFRIHTHACWATHISLECLLCLVSTCVKGLTIESQAWRHALYPVHHYQRDDGVFSEDLCQIPPFMKFLDKPGKEAHW